MISWISFEILINGSNKTTEEKTYLTNRVIELETNWNEFAEIEYYEIINDLKDNQIDKISNGISYGQTEILRHLKKLK